MTVADGRRTAASLHRMWTAHAIAFRLTSEETTPAPPEKKLPGSLLALVAQVIEQKPGYVISFASL